MGATDNFLSMFGAPQDAPDSHETLDELAERPGALDAFVRDFGGASESFWFYDNTVEVRFDKVDHEYFLVDSELGNLTLLENVSSVSHIIDRSFALIPWAAKKTIEKFLRIVPTRYVLVGDVFGTEPLTLMPIVPEMTLAKFTEFALSAKTAHSDELDAAGEIGKMAHDWIEKYIIATLNNDQATIQGLMTQMCTDQRATNACIAALDWMKAHNVRWKETERKVYSRTHKVSGTMDGLCIVDSCDDPTCCPHEFKDRLTIADWKTSNYLYIEFLFQTAAYEAFYEEEFSIDIQDRWVLRLGKEDGEFEPWHLEEEDFEDDFAGFLACLELSRIKDGIEARVSERKASTRASKKAARAEAKEAAKVADKLAKAVEKAEKKRVKMENAARVKAEAKIERARLRAETKAAKAAGFPGATPVLEGKDAEVFLDAVKLGEPVSEDRKQWLDEVVHQSKIADSTYETEDADDDYTPPAIPTEEE